MNYTFSFDWGETWTVTEDDFNWNVEYWCKVLARHIHLFRVKIKEIKPVDIITFVSICCGDDYKGLVSVSDNYVHVVLDKAETCWRVEEL